MHQQCPTVGTERVNLFEETCMHQQCTTVGTERVNLCDENCTHQQCTSVGTARVKALSSSGYYFICFDYCHEIQSNAILISVCPPGLIQLLFSCQHFQI